MIDSIEKVLFYFTIECANCHNHMKTSPVVLEEQKGCLICSLCGKTVNVPKCEVLIESSKILHEYLSDSINHKYIKLTFNESFKLKDDTPAAAH